MRNIIIIGNGGHAKSCCDVIELEKKFKIIGFISSDKNLETKSNKYLYLGTDKNLTNIRKRCDSAFVAIGHIKNNSITKLGDIRFIDQIFINNKIKTVVLLAAEHKDNVTPVQKYYDVNVQGTKNILCVMEELGIMARYQILLHMM